MKMKNLRKIVSVILSVVISCMCLATPVCAAEKSEASVMGTNVPNVGIQQIQIFPGVYDYDTGETSYYNYPSVSEIYRDGTDLLNLQVSQTTKDVFTYGNCNCWVFRILYCSDTNVTSMDFRFNNNVATTGYSTESSVITFTIPNTPSFTYDIVYYLKSGASRSCGGRVDIWE